MGKNEQNKKRQYLIGLKNRGLIIKFQQKMIEKPQQVTLEQKIKTCKQVVIQNMEKTLQHKMVYLFFSNKKIDSDLKTFSLNSKDGFIKIQFHDAEKAKKFYDEYNFRQKILLRPFNIYFNLQLSQSQMKKYFIEGLTEENQRAIFDAARKIGICKLYTNYQGATALRKLKPKGVLSFIRKDQLTTEQFEQLSQDLQKEGVKISPYVSDKGLKCSINISNFYTGDVKKDDYEIMKEAEQEVKNLVKNFIKDQIAVSINVKKREDKVSVTALLEFTENDQAMNNFELLRENFLNKGDTKAVLFLHNHENNSYFSLYTSGLEKANEEQSEKQFENELLQTFKKVNKDVLQVNVYPVQYNKTYVGRIYLRSEEAGKNFIVDYVTRREDLCKFFRDKNRITFNINVDTKTLKRIKMAEKKATDIARGIKNSEESIKKSKKNNPAINQVPLPISGLGMGGLPFGGPAMGPIGVGIMPPTMMSQNKGNLPPNMMPMGNLPPMGGMMNVAPQMGEQDPKKKLEYTIRDKEKFLKMEANTAKRIVLPSLKFAIEQAGIPQSEVQIISEKILKEELTQIFKCLESAGEIKKRAGK